MWFITEMGFLSPGPFSFWNKYWNMEETSGPSDFVLTLIFIQIIAVNFAGVQNTWIATIIWAFVKKFIQLNIFIKTGSYFVAHTVIGWMDFKSLFLMGIATKIPGTWIYHNIFDRSRNTHIIDIYMNHDIVRMYHVHPFMQNVLKIRGLISFSNDRRRKEKNTHPQNLTKRTYLITKQITCTHACTHTITHAWTHTHTHTQSWDTVLIHSNQKLLLLQTVLILLLAVQKLTACCCWEEEKKKERKKHADFRVKGNSE